MDGRDWRPAMTVEEMESGGEGLTLDARVALFFGN